MIFTGIRWTIFTKLPVAFSGGSSAKFEPVPHWKLSIWPCSVSRENRSSRAMTGLTGEEDYPSASPNATSVCPSCTVSPTAQDTEATTASAGADKRKTVFIASITTRMSPRVTRSPGLTATCVT